MQHNLREGCRLGDQAHARKKEAKNRFFLFFQKFSYNIAMRNIDWLKTLNVSELAEGLSSAGQVSYNGWEDWLKEDYNGEDREYEKEEKEWISISDWEYNSIVCPYCGEVFDDTFVDVSKWKYCPCCGRKVKNDKLGMA